MKSWAPNRAAYVSKFYDARYGHADSPPISRCRVSVSMHELPRSLRLAIIWAWEGTCYGRRTSTALLKFETRTMALNLQLRSSSWVLSLGIVGQVSKQAPALRGSPPTLTRSSSDPTS